MEALSNFKSGQSVTAISRQGDVFQTVCVRKKGHTFELISNANLTDHATWRHAGVEAGVFNRSGQRQRDAHHCVVLGLGAVGGHFTQLTLPKVGIPETQAMVQMQAETRLPLSADQMALDWKTLHQSDTQRVVTLATMRRDPVVLQELAGLEPDHVYLDAQALVQMWQWGYTGESKEGLLMSCHDHHTVLCCVQSGQLVHASVLDFGVQDFRDDRNVSDMASQFAQEVKLALQTCADYLSHCGSVTLLSDGSETLQPILQTLMLYGVETSECLPDVNQFTGKTALDASELHAMRVPIGLALCQLDEGLDAFELLKELCGEKAREQTTYRKPVIAGIAALVALALMIGVCYGVDVKRHQVLTQLIETPEVAAFKRERAYQKQVARQRVDLLDMIEVMTSKDYEGVTLDTFSFKKGQPLELKGRADKTEKWYAYEEAISNLKGVKQFKPDNAVTDEKGKKIKFGMNFHYKTYTQKTK